MYEKNSFIFFDILSSLVHAEQLAVFSNIVDAVSQGKQITLVMNLEQCSSQKTPSNAVTASARPNAFLIIDNNRITTSIKHFTLENPIAYGKPIFEFVKYNINLDGSVSIKNTVMNASNYEQLASYQYAFG